MFQILNLNIISKKNIYVGLLILMIKLADLFVLKMISNHSKYYQFLSSSVLKRPQIILDEIINCSSRALCEVEDKNFFFFFHFK
jgi:hypothetical protein